MTTRNEAADLQTRLETYLASMKWRERVHWSDHDLAYNLLHDGVFSDAFTTAKVEGVRAALEYYGFEPSETSVAEILSYAERESSLGRDAEGHEYLSLGPGTESPSRKGEQE